MPKLLSSTLTLATAFAGLVALAGPAPAAVIVGPVTGCATTTPGDCDDPNNLMSDFDPGPTPVLFVDPALDQGPEFTIGRPEFAKPKLEADFVNSSGAQSTELTLSVSLLPTGAVDWYFSFSDPATGPAGEIITGVDIIDNSGLFEDALSVDFGRDFIFLTTQPVLANGSLTLSILTGVSGPVDPVDAPPALWLMAAGGLAFLRRRTLRRG